MKGIFLLCCCATFYSSAQIPIGFKAGINLNQIVHRNIPPSIGEERRSYVTSFHVGAFTKIKLTDKFNLIPELQFIQKEAFVNSFSKIKLSYIEIPVASSYSPIRWLSIESGGARGQMKSSTILRVICRPMVMRCMCMKIIAEKPE
jgi:hypothetical protein